MVILFNQLVIVMCQMESGTSLSFDNVNKWHIICLVKTLELTPAYFIEVTLGTSSDPLC